MEQFTGPASSSADGAPDEDALMASLLLNAVVPEKEVAARKRARLDSEYSLGALSEAAHKGSGLEADSTEEDSEQYNDGEAENENMAAEDGSEEAQQYAPLMPAVLSAGATDFFERRRLAAEQARENAEGAIPASELVHGVLTPEQASTCNREGRVGVYWPSERVWILERFLTKRGRRKFEKKIRYDCRKNLADKRIRIKGRFVRAEVAAEIAEKAIITGALVGDAPSPSPAHHNRQGGQDGAGSAYQGHSHGTGSPAPPSASHGGAAVLAGAYIPKGAAMEEALRHALERGTAYATGAAQRRGRGYSVDSVGAGSAGGASGSPLFSAQKPGRKSSFSRPRASSMSHVVSGSGMGGMGGHSSAGTGAGAAAGEGSSSSSSRPPSALARERKSSVSAARTDYGDNPYQYELNLPSLAQGSRKRSRGASFLLPAHVADGEGANGSAAASPQQANNGVSNGGSGSAAVHGQAAHGAPPQGADTGVPAAHTAVVS